MIDLLILSLTLGVQPAVLSPSDPPAAMLLAEVDDAETSEAKPKPRPKRIKPKVPVPVVKTETPPKTPEAPVPYESLGDKSTPPPVKAAPLPAVSAHPPTSPAPTAPTLIAPPTLPAVDPLANSLPEPPPPPPLVLRPIILPAQGSGEISLRCETVVVSNAISSRGIFRLSLIPSEVNPDEFADIRLMTIESQHGSIMRDTPCEAFRCSVAVTPGYYAITISDRRKAQVNVTLNRQTGAFYGYEKRYEGIASGLITVGKPVEINETGWCTPEARSKTLF